jgi:hypothetical protein
MVLMLMPAARNTSAVTSSESGMATREINVVRTLSRKANSTITTRMAPSRRASSTLVIDDSMKSACLKRRVLSCTSWGREGCNSARAFSTAWVRATVAAPGCFSMLRMTAGWPFTLPSPRLKRAPKATVATCFTVTGEFAR